MKKLTPEEQSYRMNLYNNGLNDRQMGDILFLAAGAVQGWRLRNNLPANLPRNKVPPDEEARRMGLYEQGMTDGDMAEALGMGRGKNDIIWYWRKYRGLSANVKEGEQVVCIRGQSEDVRHIPLGEAQRI